MISRKPLTYAISCAIAASSLGIASLALAQDQDSPDEFSEGEVEEIIVTGSRIKRDTFTSSTPIDVVVHMEGLEPRPTSLHFGKQKLRYTVPAVEAERGRFADAAANRVALEASVKARNQGRQIEKEARDILTEAARTSPELAIAMETWKEIKFEFETVDKLDVA